MSFPQATAQRVTAGISERMSTAYNGMHLRVEGDAAGFHNRAGGLERFWQLHVEAMQSAKFDDTVPVYLATALPRIVIGSSGADQDGRSRAGDPSALTNLLFYASDIVKRKVRPCSRLVLFTRAMWWRRSPTRAAHGAHGRAERQAAGRSAAGRCMRSASRPA